MHYEVAATVRTGRVYRQARRRANHRPDRLVEPLVMISEQEAEADDLGVHGHWEGDLIMGAANRSAIGTLVQRRFRCVCAATPLTPHWLSRAWTSPSRRSRTRLRLG